MNIFMIVIVVSIMIIITRSLHLGQSSLKQLIPRWIATNRSESSVDFADFCDCDVDAWDGGPRGTRGFLRVRWQSGTDHWLEWSLGEPRLRSPSSSWGNWILEGRERIRLCPRPRLCPISSKMPVEGRFCQPIGIEGRSTPSLRLRRALSRDLFVWR